MATSLGIHVGHHASCALVRDGAVLAAVQQERFSRVKNDGEEALTDRLPISECLRAAGVNVGDVDVIVSSFQSVSNASFGLHKPLIEAGFRAFDPWDRRHRVASHHLAHAAYAAGCAGVDRGAVLVCDLGGSTTLRGRDYYLPFGRWYEGITSLKRPRPHKTECLSIYAVAGGRLDLRDREFCIPHNQPETFIQNVGSLYSNVARRVFGRHHAEGELMGLAAYGAGGPDPRIVDADLVAFDENGRPVFRNDWQHRMAAPLTAAQKAQLAFACQRATERVLLAYARRAKALTGEDALCVAGGLFLNISANTAIAESGLFSRLVVGSAPHDAGIAVGCAYLGDASGRPLRAGPQARATDRQGPLRDAAAAEDAVRRYHPYVANAGEADPRTTAAGLAAGAVVAVCRGRSEFGPRALGARSLLASPLAAGSKERLNRAKGRQPWRPVAPVVVAERAPDFFDGPDPSPWMSFAHRIKPQHRERLVALEHPDGTTRVQTLQREDDPWLYEVLLEFGRLTGFPVLCNTSLNGRGAPLVERAEEALRLFARQRDVDLLVLDGLAVNRRRAWDGGGWEHLKVGLSPGVRVTVLSTDPLRVTLTLDADTEEVSPAAARAVLALADGSELPVPILLAKAGPGEAAEEVYTLLAAGYLKPSPPLGP